MEEAKNTMATTEEELKQLEKDIRQLKIEYDQYFGGGRKRPPSEIEWRIDQIMKRNAERMGELKFAQRFHFNNLAQTYAKYKDIFRKRMQQREESNVQRHFGAAARAIEAERQRAHAGQEKRLEEARGANGFFRIACSEPDRESDKVDQLYQALIRAKQKAGDKVESLSRENFQDFVRTKTHELRKQKGSNEVEYIVEIASGKVKLKARLRK
jgi:hypothetical protein